MPRHFANWLQGYFGYTRASESPDPYHFWVGVSTIAGALRGKVWIDQKAFRWTPNFYVILVGPAGVVQKSTSLDFGMKLLEEIEGIHFGPSSSTWQSLIKTMSESAERIEYVDQNGIDLSFDISCVTLPVAELGTFLKLTSEGFAEVLIDMWEGKVQKRAWTHSTLTSGHTNVTNPWLNMIGCTTPTWLRANFPETMVGGGLTSRIVFVYGDKKRQLVAYPARQWKANEFESMRNRLIADLKQISDMKGEFKLTERAYEWGEAWYRRLWEGPRAPHLASERLDAYIARKQVFLHKLAMILAAARSNKLVLDVVHLEEADALLGDVERDMIRVFQSIGIVEEAKNMELLISPFRTYAKLEQNELFRMVSTHMDQKSFVEAIEAAVKTGRLTILKEAGKLFFTLPKTPTALAS